jgi:glucosamine-6-phosphate deaminase
MSKVAADLVAAAVHARRGAVLGLATGSTPLGLYAELVARHRAGALSFADVTTFNLDEYCGLDGAHPQSYRHFMQKNLFDLVDVDLERTHVPSGLGDDHEAACDAYERAIAAAGGIDLQLLGIGHNGHIGFNEPDDSFARATHTVELTPTTREANSRLFSSIDEVPTFARTMGIGTIMAARGIVLVASGADKAAILKATVEGPVTPRVPASILQFHPNATVVADAAAASLLA